MTPLAALQARFLAAVIDGEGGTADVRATPRFSATQRMAVYANAYRRRLVEALASTFERTARVLGDDRFDAVALAYVDSNAPTDRSLSRYGLDFPDWLRDHAAALVELRALTPTALAGVAIIDAGLRRAFDAADAEPIARDVLLALPMPAWPTLRIVPVPALATASVDAAAIPLWRDADAANVEGDAAIAFWRRDGQTFFRSMAVAEAHLLARMRAGRTLAEACAGIADDDPAIPLDVAAPALLAWVDEGWLSAVHVDA